MILEGVVTTINEDGTTHVSPMGPLVESVPFDRFLLRPFQTSMTYQNLRRLDEGVWHVTDDVELIARSAIGRLDRAPATTPATCVQGRILTAACRWYAFQVEQVDDREPRTTLRCRVVEAGRLRDFCGFCRAKHAVLEAAILATRTELLPAAKILGEYTKLELLVQKTGGPAERRAFQLLRDFVTVALSGRSE